MADWKKLFDDAVDQIGDGLTAAGEGLQELAGDAKKVAGIGVGTMELVVPQSQYELGDCITGMLELRVTEPIPAKRLVVALRATRRRHGVSSQRGRATPTVRTETLHDFECEVGGEQTYESGEHPFALHIPTRLDPKVDVDGVLGDAVRVAQTLRSMTATPIQWKLVGFLDIPWKRNLSKQIDISVATEDD